MVNVSAFLVFQKITNVCVSPALVAGFAFIVISPHTLANLVFESLAGNFLVAGFACLGKQTIEV